MFYVVYKDPGLMDRFRLNFKDKLTPSLQKCEDFHIYVGFDSFLLSFYMCGGDPT